MLSDRSKKKNLKHQQQQQQKNPKRNRNIYNDHISTEINISIKIKNLTVVVLINKMCKIRLYFHSIMVQEQNTL